ncbi:MAG: hypothetical protein ACI8UO_006609, partial [Verrucomicrobiales bacterium]
LTLYSQHSSLFIGEEYALPSHLLHQYADLRILEVDHFLLLAIDPACENQREELPWLKNESHRIAITEIGTNNRG